jgi:hypothetical protein
MNLTFKNVKVRSFSLDFIEVTWEIEDTELDPHDFVCFVLRSESPMGPWDIIGGPFEDKYLFIDNRIDKLHRWRTLHYKIRSIRKSDPTDVAESEAASQTAEPDLIAEEIQRLERLLWQEFAGRRCFIFPARTFGQRCGNCYDGPDKGKGFTSQRRRSGCLTCYDTGYVGGYLDPIETFMQIDPTTSNIQLTQIVERHPEDATARLPNFPLVKPRDLIVEAENKRWRVVRVTPTERLRSVVHQELVLHAIPLGDIEYKIPIRIEDLRNFEPSPMRNFVNPHSLENFEAAALHHVRYIYGY